QKTIEVATFRKNVADTPVETPPEPAVVATAAPGLPVSGPLIDADAGDELTAAQRDLLAYFGGGRRSAARVGPVSMPATRSQSDAGESRAETPEAGRNIGDGREAGDSPAEARDTARGPGHGAEAGIVHRDNTFGTTEEDAFRRDFTVNALFYDASTKSI